MTRRGVMALAVTYREATTEMHTQFCTKRIAAPLVVCLALPAEAPRIDALVFLWHATFNAQMRTFKPLPAILGRVRIDTVQVADDPGGLYLLLFEG